jgi:hypothetical protein
MPESTKNIQYHLTDTLELYFYITDENGSLISDDDWDDVVITIKDDFNADSPTTVLDAHAGTFTTFAKGVTPGNVRFFMTADDLTDLIAGTWEYRVIITKDVAGDDPAEQITAARGYIYGI